MESRMVIDDPQYRQGALELLGVLAYGELSASERLAEDAKFAPTLREKAAIARLAVVEFGNFEVLRTHIEQVGADPFELMQTFAASFEEFHKKTAPRDWLQGLVKAYVGDGLAADFFREIAAFVDPQTRALIVENLGASGIREVVVPTVRAAIEADPTVAGPLALWGRRLMGEALVQGQLIVAEHEELASVVVGGEFLNGMDLSAIARMFTRLTDAHAGRMAELGLSA
jgi:hypothetical protein